ncbi:MAG: DUF3422 domain-containing protein [Salibaculum sp.]|jgi:uncharacterized membrane-anchored protein|uniref:DUF3422 family protein n=1 Tax=Roseovarius halophilus (ex Wu et al. 2025) TaxID=3376060 RepID=UPI00286FC08A|nr:DUF3422 domain-containing protein [Salibaculum sp.]MDR9428143.1 DUF3422 domain-containing protein [Salibaculum sp.]MDR9481851.1 DUF3422 domain-containing protein [Salibaculum sp.]
MTGLQEHPLRFAVANELHARPFPQIEAPCRAAFLALKPAQNAAQRDRGADLAHLKALLDRYAAPHPEEDATHYFGQIGKYHLKWESHTEFVTYTIFGEGVSEAPFDARTFAVFPEDWLAAAPGVRVTSALIRVEVQEGDEGIPEKLADWFVADSLAVSRVLDDAAVTAADFRIDPGGHMRFAVFARRRTGARRVGRVIQRLCEIETYKAMAMLGFFSSKDLSGKLAGLDGRLSALTSELSGAGSGDTESTLRQLLQVSGELEDLSTAAAFRFGATGAYETIVNQRLQVLREARFNGRQTFAEFMMRRFDPAMRTVASTKDRLEAMSARALRASDLLRTRVDVQLSRENKVLLESMDRRADLQLRLQKTVEGLSVVAISYYAVNLVLFLLGPLGGQVGLDKPMLGALVTLPVVVAVWALVQRVRKTME